MSPLRTVFAAIALAAAAVAVPASPAEPVVAPYTPSAFELPEPVRMAARHVVALPASNPGKSAPWFATPVAAMRYLTWAYNGKHEVELRHVTTPAGREALESMRGYMPTVRLVRCAPIGTGAYDCAFRHSLAKHPGKEGDATFRVAPALAHGWYMTVIVDCGDDETY